MTLVMIIYSSFAIVLSLLYFILPETKGKEMPDTLMQAENMDFELEVVDKKRPTINWSSVRSNTFFELVFEIQIVFISDIKRRKMYKIIRNKYQK